MLITQTLSGKKGDFFHIEVIILVQFHLKVSKIYNEIVRQESLAIICY